MGSLKISGLKLRCDCDDPEVLARFLEVRLSGEITLRGSVPGVSFLCGAAFIKSSMSSSVIIIKIEV